MIKKHISYDYDAIGTKLQKEVRDDTQGGFVSIDRTYYAGAFTYEKKISDTSQKLKFITQPEGYIDMSSSPPSGEPEGDYVYNFTDHLGNIRLSYSDKDNDGQITASTEIIEEKNYYPFGLKHKGYNSVINGQHYPYGYNGKEENDELGLEWLDFGARNYNASLGRWMNLDPLAELMRRHSPYNYAFDNPVFFIDPDGRTPEGFELSSASLDYYEFSSDSQTSPSKKGKTENSDTDYVNIFNEQGKALDNIQNEIGSGGENSISNSATQDSCPECPPKVYLNQQSFDEVLENLISWAIYVDRNRPSGLYAYDIISGEGEKHSMAIGAYEAMGAGKDFVDRDLNSTLGKLNVRVDNFNLQKNNNWMDNNIRSIDWKTLGNNRYSIYFLNDQGINIIYLNFKGKEYFDYVLNRILNPIEYQSIDGKVGQTINFPKKN